MKSIGQKTSGKNILKQKSRDNMEKKQLKVYSSEEANDILIGKRGTPVRDEFEHKLNMGIMGYMLKKARQERNLTQEQLGKLVGVQKAQISKLESGANSATIDTIYRVAKALKAEITFKVKLGNQYLSFS